MMPKWVYWVAGIILALAFAFYAGVRKGKTDERLAVNKVELIKNDSVNKLNLIKVDSAKVKVAALETTHNAIRAKVRVVHDTIFAKGENNSDSATIISPALAHLIQADDSLISAQKHSLALTDTLIAALRTGMDLRDVRIKLLESRGTSRFSKGFQAGVGYCQTATSRTPCGYIGYGISVRLP